MNRVSRRHVPSNNPNFIRSTKRPNYPAFHYELLPMLGVKGQRLPDEGVPVQYVQGNIAVWVEPKVGKKQFIRTRAICPNCLREFAASRLNQHKCR